MANPNVEYLGVMAWVAQFQWIPDKTPPGDRLEMRCNLNKIKVGEEVRKKIFSVSKFLSYLHAKSLVLSFVLLPTVTYPCKIAVLWKNIILISLRVLGF